MFLIFCLKISYGIYVGFFKTSGKDDQSTLHLFYNKLFSSQVGTRNFMFCSVLSLLQLIKYIPVSKVKNIKITKKIKNSFLKC